MTTPAEHPKKHPPPFQPNAHPYAIKTTSTALLSRSNSSPHTAHHTRHHYIPLSPSRAQVGTKLRHRHSSSLSSVEGAKHNGAHATPSPLPAPPPVVLASPDDPFVSLERADEPKITRRVRRAETMPSSATPPINLNEVRSGDQKHTWTDDRTFRSVQELYASLPPNPKKWNTDELTTYLSTSLKQVKGIVDGDYHDSSLVDIVECVRARGLTGRELLRLTDVDLVNTPLSDLQRTQLLGCSRSLRADILRGRIYVDSYHSHEVSDNSDDVYSKSAHSSTPFRSMRGASLSVDNLLSLLDNTGQGEDAFPPSPAMSLHRSNSVSDASAERYRDLARMRMRRRGRVKGLVETWERANTSGSECSAGEGGSIGTSDADSESDTDPMFQSVFEAKHSPESSPSDLSSSLHDEPLPRDVGSPMAGCSTVLQESISLPQPPPYSYVYTAHQDEEEEPSIEELLASSSNLPLIGARAWEADVGLGETVKRIPSVAAGTSLATESGLPGVLKDDHQQANGGSTRSKGSVMRHSAGSRRKNRGTQKRVVTAIFTGSLTDETTEDVTDAVGLVGDSTCRDAPAIESQTDTNSAIRALEESITTTRAQIDAFKLRLEKVEADTARLEDATVIQAQISDHLPASELKRRRPETGDSPRAEMAELHPRDEALTSGTKDALESWEGMSLSDIARAIIAKAMGWMFPYGHLGTRASEERHDGFRAQATFQPGTNDKQGSRVKRNDRLSLARTSCSLVLVSFALCAAVLRRIGFGRWVRRP